VFANSHPQPVEQCHFYFRASRASRSGELLKISFELCVTSYYSSICSATRYTMARLLKKLEKAAIHQFAVPQIEVPTPSRAYDVVDTTLIPLTGNASSASMLATHLSSPTVSLPPVVADNVDFAAPMEDPDPGGQLLGDDAPEIAEDNVKRPLKPDQVRRLLNSTRFLLTHLFRKPIP
jgi:hypothetical protein